MLKNKLYPILLALLAALLFGASAPLSKILLGDVEPVMLAAFLYLGSGFGLLIVKIFQQIGKKSVKTEAKIRKSDLIWLIGATIAGGIAAPIILLFGLRDTPAATASLLLNFEGVATTIIAAFAFKESVSRRAWYAIITITAASIFLSVNLNSEWGFSIGALGILAACFLWGVDNNLTRNISAKDPLTIVTIKGLVAGTFSLILAIITGNVFPGWTVVLGAMLLGSLSYGLSITLFIRAMRGMGAARTSALFGTAPLAGLILSFILFQETINFLFLLAIPLMLVGTIFLVTEDHVHLHTHEKVIHDHSHSHNDGHHEHVHPENKIVFQQHSHLHEHSVCEHDHHHMPDTHHRHTHSSQS
ncbi:MAG: EamA family transporter [Chloroflexi bacterium HGW-Chloroflexi-10]|nr:MAG: EamA family transporter [Chloroflexi bacterium HGW-Chloroflexi-10]